MDVQQYSQKLRDAFEKADTALDSNVESWLNSASKDDVAELMKICTPRFVGSYPQLPDVFRDLKNAVVDLSVVGQLFGSLTGQAVDFYDKYTSHVFLMLGLYSLPYCYQSADGAKVLAHSRRLKDQPVKRLEETSAFVKQVFDAAKDSDMHSLIDINFRIRLIHAVSRAFAKRHVEFLPINQAELLGTSFAFGSLVLRALRKINLAVNQSVAEDWLRLFNLTAYLQGVDLDLLPQSTKQVWIAEQVISKAVFRPSSEGHELAVALFKSLDQQLNAPISSEKLASHLLGAKASTTLQIEPVTQVNSLIYQTLAKVLDLRYRMA